MNTFPPPLGPPSVPPPVTPPSPKRWHRVAVIGAIAVVALAAVGGVAATLSSEPSSEADAEAPAPPPTSEQDAATDEPTEGEGLMPDVVCMNLQDAQDTIQTKGVFFSRSRDATGEGRRQLIDSNWQVVAQTPAPGTPIGEFEAVLEVVKFGEPSPC
jgi:hypothetical protein